MAKTFKGEIRFVNFAANDAIVKESIITASYNTVLDAYDVSATAAIVGVSGTVGTASIEYPTAMVAANPTGLVAGPYTLNMSLNGSTSVPYTVTVPGASTYTSLVTAIQTSLGAGVVVSLSVPLATPGAIIVSSTIPGVSSSVLLTDGATLGLIQALNVARVESATIVDTTGINPTQGYQNLVSSSLPIIADRDTKLSAGTYNLKVAVNGGAAVSYPIVVSAETIWSVLVATIETAVKAVANVKLVGNSIVFTSNTYGAASAMAVTDGVVSGLLAAINSTLTTLDITEPNYKLVFLKGDFLGYVKGDIIKYQYVANKSNTNQIFII